MICARAEIIHAREQAIIAHLAILKGEPAMPREEQELRLECLRLACGYGSDLDVISVAERFYEFLTAPKATPTVADGPMSPFNPQQEARLREVVGEVMCAVTAQFSRVSTADYNDAIEVAVSDLNGEGGNA